MNKKPPKIARRFFRWYCHKDLRESIEGDLEERFEDNLQSKGLLRARLAYILDVFRFMNKYTIRKSPAASRPGFIYALGQNLTYSFRFLKRHRQYTFINTLGLSFGLAAALLIALFVQRETSFDSFHENADRIYRINNIYEDEQGNRFPLANSSPAFASEFPKAMAAYEKATRMRYTMRVWLGRDGISFYEDHSYYADSLFFDVFSFPLLAGEADRALDEPNSIVLTEAMALKYFGKTRPMGELLTLNGDQPLRVTGILAPIPDNSHLNFDFLISFSTYEVPAGYASDLTSWGWGGFFTYALVSPGTNIDYLNQQTIDFIAAQTGSGGMQIKVQLQALKNIYLGSAGFPDDLNSHVRSSSRFTVYALGIVAVLILCICAFNYTNLSAAMALQRGKEMGVKKMLGANNSSIRWQLFSDAALMIMTAMVTAGLLLWCTNLAFSGFDSLSFRFDLSQALSFLGPMFGLGLLFALIVSIYPAMLFTNLSASSTIRSKFIKGKSPLTRRVLVGLQFCISLGLLSSALVIKDQLDFIRQQNLGIDKEHLLTIQSTPEDMSRYYASLKSSLEQKANIVQVTKSERLVGDPWPVNNIRLYGQAGVEDKQVVGNQVGFDYLQTLGVNLKSGRFFSPEIPKDLNGSIVINQAAVDLLNLEDPLGKEVEFFSANGPREIIGVMEDFHFSSLHETIGPMVLIMPFIELDHITIRVASGNLAEKIADIQSSWNEVTPGIPLDLRFTDDRLEQLYRSEQNLGALISFFSGLAVVLACLGLYGLISFNTRSRLKEISIRKIIGAKAWSLLRLLSLEYFVLLMGGAILAVPLAYYLLESWLSSFAYRIHIGPSYFVLAIVLFGSMCFATIAQHLVKAVRANPVKYLRED